MACEHCIQRSVAIRRLVLLLLLLALSHLAQSHGHELSIIFVAGGAEQCASERRGGGSGGETRPSQGTTTAPI